MRMAANNSLDSLLGNVMSLVPDRSGEPATTRGLRLAARDSLVAGSFDIRGREEWKYTNLKPVIERGFVPYTETKGALSEVDALLDEQRARSAAEAALKATSDPVAWRLVFVNGIYRGDLSQVTELPDGVVLLPMTAASDLPGLGDLADFRNAPFTALNTAAWGDGLLLELPDDAVLDRPVELHFLSDERAAGRTVAPRNLIRAGRRTRATVIEFFTGSNGSAVVNAPVTEIVCGEGADLRHWKVIREDDEGLHYGSTHVRQEAGSSYASREFSFGGAGVRRELHVDLAGPEATCDLTSLVMAGDRQRMDNRTRISHLVPGCTTNELYKGIYADHSRGVFDGLIKVERDAQQTAAHQTNRSLLLSDDASVSSIPRLEIYADDVKCSHGSTTGQLNEEEVFFLRSRGFDASSARTMLAQAFAREIVDGVESPELCSLLNEEIVRRLGVIEDGEATR